MVHQEGEHPRRGPAHIIIHLGSIGANLAFSKECVISQVGNSYNNDLLVAFHKDYKLASTHNCI